MSMLALVRLQNPNLAQELQSHTGAFPAYNDCRHIVRLCTMPMRGLGPAQEDPCVGSSGSCRIHCGGQCHVGEIKGEKSGTVIYNLETSPM